MTDIFVARRGRDPRQPAEMPLRAAFVGRGSSRKGHIQKELAIRIEKSL